MSNRDPWDELVRQVKGHLSAHESSYRFAQDAGDEAAMDRCAARVRVCNDMLDTIRMVRP